MSIPSKSRWTATASSGDPRLAIDDRYTTAWTTEPSRRRQLEIDLSEPATLAGLKVYWGARSAESYAFETSSDRRTWTRLCGTRHGEGGLDVFGFPPVAGRYLRCRLSYGPGTDSGVGRPG